MFKAVCVFDTGGKLRAHCQTSVTSSTITSWHTLIIENHEWSSHGVTTLQYRLQFSRGTRQQARTCDRQQLDPLVSSEQTTNPPVRVIYNLPKPDTYTSADAPDLSQTPPRGDLEPDRSGGWKKNMKKKKRTRPSSDAAALALPVPPLSLGAGLLHLGDGLRCIAGEDERSAGLLDHHVVLDPDAQAAETLWRQVVVLTDVQAWDRTEKK